MYLITPERLEGSPSALLPERAPRAAPIGDDEMSFDIWELPSKVGGVGAGTAGLFSRELLSGLFSSGFIALSSGAEGLSERASAALKWTLLFLHEEVCQGRQAVQGVCQGAPCWGQGGGVGRGSNCTPASLRAERGAPRIQVHGLCLDASSVPIGMSMAKGPDMTGVLGSLQISTLLILGRSIQRKQSGDWSNPLHGEAVMPSLHNSRNEQRWMKRSKQQQTAMVAK
ncbi:MAG: hypothetical protein FRX49_09075 [Trebouxia sp. A1-2]|nr:MAG: hypothetical protein FRX49_09075 [Trebouxia sp. A1-2]